jgi:hypothetical protein
VRPSVQGVAIRTGILSDMPLLSYQLCGNPMTLEDGSHVSACAGKRAVCVYTGMLDTLKPDGHVTGKARLPFAPER